MSDAKRPDSEGLDGAGGAPRRVRAAALAYDPNWRAPRVLAKGYGQVGQSIIDTARAHGVVVTDSPELVDLLMRVDIDREIPPELYLSVARILAWVAALDARGPFPQPA